MNTNLNDIPLSVLCSDVQKVKDIIASDDDEVTTILCHNAAGILKAWEDRVKKQHRNRQNAKLPFIYEATFMVVRGLHAYLHYLDSVADDTAMLNTRDICAMCFIR
jgi:hypothetical protein